MNIKIEHGIPMPNQQGTDSSATAIALKKLKVGDSIVFPKARRSGVQSMARYHGIKVATRTAGKGKFRLWRTQ